MKNNNSHLSHLLRQLVWKITPNPPKEVSTQIDISHHKHCQISDDREKESNPLKYFATGIYR